MELIPWKSLGIIGSEYEKWAQSSYVLVQGERGELPICQVRSLQLVEIGIGAFSFMRILLAWNSYECHIEDTVKNLLATEKI